MMKSMTEMALNTYIVEKVFVIGLIFVGLWVIVSGGSACVCGEFLVVIVRFVLVYHVLMFLCVLGSYCVMLHL